MREEGLSLRAISTAMKERGFKISHETVNIIVKSHGNE